MLEDRIIIITGGGSGIGAATAQKVAEEGGAVVVADINEANAQKVASQIVAAGGRAIAVQVDVTDPAANERMVALAKAEFGAIHGAYLNAGTMHPGSILESDIESWKQVIDVNLNALFYGMRALVPVLDAGASIVVTSSVAGLLGTPYMVSYTAAKHGALGFMKAAAAELAPKKIRVNAVCPGGILTPLVGVVANDPDLKRRVGNAHPLRRMGEPEEVANVAVFLLSERSSFITAESIAVEGGCTNILAEGEGFPDVDKTMLDSATEVSGINAEGSV